MRRVEHLITQVRRQTENVRKGITDGITDEEFVQYLNDGQRDLYRSVMAVHSRAFTKVAFVDTVRGQDTYDLPASVFNFHKIVNMQYSHTGKPQNYQNLKKSFHGERMSVEALPRRYILQGDKQFLLDPIPNKAVSNGIRITYDPYLPKVDKRRALVSSVTITAGVVTALNIGGTLYNEEDYNNDDYLSFVDDQGVIQAIGLPYTDVTSGTVSILNGAYDLPDGQTISPGDYVVLGENATTNSQLPENCEDYLLAYAAWKIFRRDSSTDAVEQDKERQAIKNLIVENFADAASDATSIPILDLTYDPEEWYG